MTDEEREGKGFVVRDRRRFTEEGEVKQEVDNAEREEAAPRADRSSEASQQTESKAPREESTQTVLPEINFSTFIFSLNTSALLHLGDYPDPATGK
ncbi:MAG: DUF1844 domain-containing protein, partial [Deltaproteobacteria bacterium]|nr:DUF1844 domain-containing protein [Deltaproteobacteria bacterium]